MDRINRASNRPCRLSPSQELNHGPEQIVRRSYLFAARDPAPTDPADRQPVGSQRMGRNPQGRAQARGRNSLTARSRRTKQLWVNVMVAHLQPIRERLERYSIPEPNSGCLLWTAKIDRDGYPRVWLDGKIRGAHRVVYELKNGPIPDGLQIDHLCRVRCCINPDHLEAVTPKANTNRGVSSIVNSGQKKFFCKTCGGPLEVVARRNARDGRNPHNERGCRMCRYSYMVTWRKKRRT